MPNWVLSDWTNPALVIGRYPPPDEELWIVYVDGVKSVVEEKNYEIKLLSSDKCHEHDNINND